MTAPSIERFSEEASALLQHYSFDLAGYSTDHLIAGWQQTYSASWIRTAVIEALYQGRYKAVSVEQILLFWLRRGQPLRHFNHEFECIVCNQSGHKRTRRNCPMIHISEPSISASSTTNLVEQGSDHPMQQPYPSASETETNSPPESSTEPIDQQLISPISNHSTRDHSSASNHSKKLNHQLPTHELESLGNLTESSAIESSNHKADDFALPNNQALLNPIWQLNQSAAASESQHKTPSDGGAAKLTTGRNSKNNTSIHQFRPASDCSEFYLKLRAVAQQSKNGISNPVD